ncbi:hypothetical protein CS0771_43400 [Catellatospora sp. IY07-71]|nr:hypothetical protein CS0771_43400 [Catellatospora sp. IY07-71]
MTSFGFTVTCAAAGTAASPTSSAAATATTPAFTPNLISVPFLCGGTARPRRAGRRPGRTAASHESPPSHRRFPHLRVHPHHFAGNFPPPQTTDDARHEGHHVRKGTFYYGKR